ncbi:hypothetical protein [Rhizobium binae]|uniref:Uncharacterized protein n=1 Tax=Rhizobium binae TaxID=1138190 RepID=A0ABV2MQP5_9HYPH|nr:hypothetical protein [Rhizobium binae]NKL51793.1 hypothetical protein [Rhizobium leguminosarum bv. viciae]MBX4939790.1 hypothetical protein [Rhizobium binae]MBX4946309.1 hypothetical protein [Rhizobium binae]MBX4981774.1 hypothetical protein [Rhizobium binae]MBX4994160.1 hypothetical protein [Rhizobium binae]
MSGDRRLGIPIDDRWNDIYLLKATGYGENFSSWTILEIFSQKSASIRNIRIKTGGISSHFGYFAPPRLRIMAISRIREPAKTTQQKPQLPEATAVL